MTRKREREGRKKGKEKKKSIYIVGEHFEKSPDKFGRGG